MPRPTPAACSPLWIGEVSDASLWTHKPRSHTLWTGVGPRKDGQEFTGSSELSVGDRVLVGGCG